MHKPLILGIESSCDETSTALMVGRKLIAQKTATQLIHEKYGGVVPELAARSHHANIVTILNTTLATAQRKVHHLNLIAVTQGPGLLGSLLVGVSFAQGLAKAHDIPLIGIHHTKAHLLANFIEPPYPSLPFLGLIVSGGHTQLVHAKSPLDMTLLGSTLDDAVGEAFDKIGKMMQFPYPAGIHIDQHAQQGNPNTFTFPKANINGFDFSFSGIKTSFLYLLQKKTQQNPNFLEKNRHHLCASIQKTLIDMLIQKVTYAMQQTNLKNIVVGGGVASNSELRTRLTQLGKQQGWTIFFPAPPYCTDNAAMIAMSGYFHWQAKAYSHTTMPDPRMPF